jgi:hypothetical protein
VSKLHNYKIWESKIVFKALSFVHYVCEKLPSHYKKFGLYPRSNSHGHCDCGHLSPFATVYPWLSVFPIFFSPNALCGSPALLFYSHFTNFTLFAREIPHSSIMLPFHIYSQISQSLKFIKNFNLN